MRMLQLHCAALNTGCPFLSPPRWKAGGKGSDCLRMEWSGGVQWLGCKCSLSCPCDQTPDLSEENFVLAHGLREQPSWKGRHDGGSSSWLWKQGCEAACSQLGWSRNTGGTGEGPCYEPQGLSFKTPTSSSQNPASKAEPQHGDQMFQHMCL